MRRNPGSSRNGQSRERLLSVAQELFARQGYEETSVREITSRARANLGAITYHFGSKEALYHATIASVVEPLVEAVGHAAQQPGSALDRIESIVRAFLDHVARNPGAPALLIRELASDRPIPPPMAHAMKRNLGTLTSTIADGQREGTIRPGDPTLFALGVVAQPFFLTVAARLIREGFGMDRDDPAVRARVVEHVAAGIRRFIASHPEAEP